MVESNRHLHVKLYGVEVQFDTMANFMTKEGSESLDFDQSKVEMKDFEEAIESPYDVSEGSVSLDFDKDKLEGIIEPNGIIDEPQPGQGKFDLALPKIFCVISQCN